MPLSEKVQGCHLLLHFSDILKSHTILQTSTITQEIILFFTPCFNQETKLQIKLQSFSMQQNEAFDGLKSFNYEAGEVSPYGSSFSGNL